MTRRHLPRSGIEEIKALFKITSPEHILHFEEAINDAVKKMSELIQENPDYWSLQVSNLYHNCAYISYDPTTTDIGDQVLRKINTCNEYMNNVDISDVLYLTIITAPKRRNN